MSPPFRALTDQEDEHVVDQINGATPDIVWVGLGTPTQERWMAAHVGRIHAAALVGVGAAFDFHAGIKHQAPRWMQRMGLEWTFRLLTEPRRLWRRYLINNPAFIGKVVLELAGITRRPTELIASAARSAADRRVPSRQNMTLLRDALQQHARTWHSWLNRGFWAISDQGLFAVANFSLNVVLARWLPTADYGAFALAYALFLLFGTCHSAFFTEPVLVLGSTRYTAGFAPYLRVVLRGHWLATAAMSFLLALAGVALSWGGERLLGAALLGLAAAAPFILLSWLLRRACYVVGRPEWASAAGALYLVLVMTAATALSRARMLTAMTALLVIGACSLVAAAWLAVRLRRVGAGLPTDVDRAAIRAQHASYGRWAAGSSALGWLLSGGYYFALPVWHGLAAAAALRALANLIMPVLQAQSALAAVIVPSLAGARGTRRFGLVLRATLLWFAIGAITYGIALVAMRHPVLHYLYAGRFDEFGGMLIALAFVPLLSGLCDVAAAGLRTLERPDLIFRSYLVAAFVAVAAGGALVVTRGLSGAIVGMILSLAVLGAVSWTMLLRLSRRAA